MNKEEIIGTDLEIDVGKDNKGRLNISGNSEQESREGYNLFNALELMPNGNNIDENNFIVSNIHTTSTIFFNSYKLNFDYGTYKISGKYTNSLNLNNVNCCLLLVKNADGSTKIRAESVTYEDGDEGIYLIVMKLFSNTNAIGQTYDAYYNDIMITKGTEEKPYEPYGAMPSPEYPSRIRNVGDNVQLFDKDDENIENGYLNANGVVVSNDTYRVSDFIKILNMKNLTISGNYGGSEIICFYDGSKTFLSSINMLTNKIKTFDIPNEAHYIRVTLHKTVLNTYKLEKGTQATPWTHFGYGSADIKVQTENLFDEKFRQGGSNGGGENRVFSSTDLRLPAGFYTFSTNLDLDTYQFGINGSLTPFPATSFPFDTGWKSQANITVKFSQLMYFGLNIRKKDNSNITPEEIEEYWFKLELGEIATDYVKHEEQTIHFPLTKVLHKDDYLADDGIHYKRKTIVLDGTENIGPNGNGTDWNSFVVTNYSNIIDKSNPSNILSNMLMYKEGADSIGNIRIGKTRIHSNSFCKNFC